MSPPSICAFWKPAARSRAARWCNCSAARSICRSKKETPCMSRQASCRPTATRDWRPINLQPVRQALDFILRQQEPYPGIVVDGRWDVRMRNQGSARLLKPFRDSYEMEAGVADNAMHVVFHPKGLRQFIVNWDEFAGQMIQILHRDVAQGSRAAAQLLDEIMAYPGLSAEWRLPRQVSASSPVMTMHLAKGDYSSRLLLHLYDAGDADGRRAATDQDRMFLPGGRRDRREGAATRTLTKPEEIGNETTCSE